MPIWVRILAAAHIAEALTPEPLSRFKGCVICITNNIISVLTFVLSLNNCPTKSWVCVPGPEMTDHLVEK